MKQKRKKKLNDHIHPINSYFMSLCANDKALWLLSREDGNILSALVTYINCCFEKRTYILFYGDLVYKFKRIVLKPNFSDQFKKIVKRYIRVGYTWISCDSLHA